jgi:hydrogenase/urease accessory protein HupE
MFIVSWIVALLAVQAAQAHPVARGSLEIRLRASDVVLRVQVSDEQVLVAKSYGGVSDHGAYLLKHFRVAGSGRPLSGRVIRLPGKRPVYELEYALAGTRPDVLQIEQDVLREFEFAPGNLWEASYFVQAESGNRLLTHQAPLSFELDWTIPSDPRLKGASAWRLARDFVAHGVLHILTGYDHLLFVVALLLAVVTLWDLVLVISAFTLAHTLTLVVSTLDLFRLPSSVVEPMIAASIVIVALQNAFWPSQSRGRGRLLTAFGFGLFHGLGFAGGLLETMEAMQGATVALAIAAFSLGVEIGHQLVVLPLYGALSLLRRKAVSPAAWLKRYGSVGVSIAGAYYLAAALS